MASARFLGNVLMTFAIIRAGVMLTDVSVGNIGLATAGTAVLNRNGTTTIGSIGESISSISVRMLWPNKPPTASSAMAKATFLPNPKTSSTTGPTSILSPKTSTSRSTIGMKTKQKQFRKI